MLVESHGLLSMVNLISKDADQVCFLFIDLQVGSLFILAIMT